MLISVMRKVTFCAGHRLLHHEGKCANLHGHNYLVEFHVSGQEIDALGRVVDFSVLNRLFKSWIDEFWDHGFLLWEADRQAISAVRQVTPHRLYVLPYNPTAENLARHLLLDIGPELLQHVSGYDLQLTRVVVWESANSSATAAIAGDGQLFFSAESGSAAAD